MNFRWKGESGNNWSGILSGDAKGYYSYLPSIFYYKDFGKQTASEQHLIQTKTGTVIKYFAGTSLLNTPFFICGFMIDKLFDRNWDPYDKPFQYLISLSALFYLLVGFWASFKTMKMLNIDASSIGFSLISIFFGTNLLFYTISSPGMSHVYSYTMIALFGFLSAKYFKRVEKKYLIFAGIIYGVIVIIRPTNAIVILIVPFLSYLMNGSFSISIKALFYFSVPVFSFLFIQCLLWYIQNGNWLIWSYKGEGFYWLKPQFLNVLFSYRRGLFVYTPLTFFSLFGLYFIYKKNKKAFLILSLLLFLSIYIISSWWSWEFGDGYGMRAMIDYYFVFALLLAFFLSSLNRNSLIAFIIFITLMIMLNLVQSWQYQFKIIHPFNMDKEKYWYVFLKTGEEYRNKLGGNIDLPPFSRKEPQLLLSEINNFETEHKLWQQELLTVGNGPSKPGNMAAMVNGNKFSSTFILRDDSILFNSDRIYIKISLDKLDMELNGSSAANMVIDVSNEKGESEFYYSFLLNELPGKEPKEWRTFNYATPLPEIRNPNRQLKIYIWNPQQQFFLIDNIKIDLYNYLQE